MSTQVEEWEPVGWEVRVAVHDEIPAIAAGVSELLVELGGGRVGGVDRQVSSG